MEMGGPAFIPDIGPDSGEKQTCDREKANSGGPARRDPSPWQVATSPDSTMSLFTPDDPWNTSRLFRFVREVNGKHGLQLESYEDLHQWSTTHIDLFWSHVWDHTGIIGSKGARVVDATVTPAANPAWFCDSAINFAENLLSNRSPEVTAVVQVCTLSPMYARSSWRDLACSGTNFPESQARARPSLQRAALLARRRRGLCLSPVRACPR